MVPVNYDAIRLAGGLDLVSPVLSLKPGVVREASNFECSTFGGYTRIAGCERYSGQPSPAAATYYVCTATITGTIAVGNTITGTTSGATGVVSWIDDTRIVMTKITGAFVDGEALFIGGSPVALLITTGIGTSSEVAIWRASAADIYRADISAPPGSGPVRGVVYFNDIAYAFRDNAGGTAGAIYKSSGSGWTSVSLGYQVAFTAGGAATPVDGAILTQGGVTATVQRVAVQSGAWTGTAAGIFVITAPGGGNFAAGAATLTGGATVTLSGVQTAITRAAGGKCEFDIGNFTGSATTRRIYGADGVNKGFEFDGSIYVPITTGMATDTPKHVVIHKNHLFFSFGASLQSSGLGLPFAWSVLLGASEMAVGEEVSVMLVQSGSEAGGALAVYTSNKTMIVYGSSSADWNMVVLSASMGAAHYSGQNLGQSYVFDDRGITSLAATQAYGNFTQSTLTNNISPLIADKRSLVTTSCVNREKSQYRVFFTDGTGLYLTIVNGKYLGAMPVTLPWEVTCAWSGENNSGDEVTFIGTDDGYVRQFDVGTSFDGEDIVSFFTLVHGSARSPRTLKRYRHAFIEVSGQSYASFEFGYTLAYNSRLVVQPQPQEYSGSMLVYYWDSGITWDSVYWDGEAIMPSEIEMEGTGENVAIAITGSANYMDSFTINSIIVHYSPRRGIR